MQTAFVPYVTEPRIESEEMTPLMFATYLGFTPTVKLLLDYGADVHVTNSFGKKAVDYAKEANRTDLLKLFDAN